VKKRQLVAIGTALMMAFLQCNYVIAAEGDEEPETIEYATEDEADAFDEVIAVDSADDIFYGYIQDDYEPPMADSWYDSELMCASDVMESSYNGYELGYLPAIRNQNPYGTCWAHSAIGSLEIYLSKNCNTTVDLSELQIAYYSTHNYDDPKDCHDADTVEYTLAQGISTNYLMIGGNVPIAYHEMMNLVGATDESIVPYSLGKDYEAENMYALGYDTVQLSEALAINIKDREGIKNAVKMYGGVGVSYYSTSSSKASVTLTTNGVQKQYYAYCNKKYNTAYSNVPATNHAVMIVGWDDSIKADQFGEEGCQPEGDGAWLIRNSWGGEGYCYNGYFYLSYYDISLMSSKAAYVLIPSMNHYDNVYSYEGNGGGHTSVKALKYTNSDGSERAGYVQGFKQSYYVDGGERIEAIAVETDNTNLTIDVEVNADGKVVKGQLLTSYAGYHTVVLDTPLDIYEDTLVTVTVKFSKTIPSDELITVMYERDGGYTLTSKYGSLTYHNTVSSIDSFLITEEGKMYNWNCDFCMKIYTTNISQAVKVEYVNLSLSGDIGLNLYLETYGYNKSDLQGYSATITCDGEIFEQLSIGDSDIVDYGNRWYYRFGSGLAAKDWDKVITIHLYDAEGKPVSIANSNMADGTGFACTISGYIKALQNRNDDRLTTLTQYLTSYCEYASCYFGQSEQAQIEERITSVIGGTAHTEVMSYVNKVDQYDVVKYEKAITGSVDGLTYLGSSLLLKSKTAIRHYFMLESGNSLSDLNITINGVAYTLAGSAVIPCSSGNIFYIDVSNIKPSLYHQTCEVSIDDMTLKYSVYSYLYDAMISDSAAENEVYDAMIKLLYLYGCEASKYYGE